MAAVMNCDKKNIHASWEFFGSLIINDGYTLMTIIIICNEGTNMVVALILV